MDPTIQELADQARSGEPGPFQALVAALRTADGGQGSLLIEALEASDDMVRRAAAVASPSAQPSSELADALVRRLRQDEDWQVRRACARALAAADGRRVLPALLAALARDGDRDVSEACALSVEAHLDTLGGYPADVERPALSALEEVRLRAGVLGPERFPLLTGWLNERLSHDVDHDRLRLFGRVLTAEVDAGTLPRAYGVDPLCEALAGILTGGAPRAAVLLGEPGVGKTAVVHELTHRLARDPRGAWHVVRVSPADLLAGTLYLGEWQTRVRDLVHAARAPRRVILYVPNLEELSQAGRSAQSDGSLATALAPHVESGEIAVVGESTPEAFRSGLGAVGSLRRLFHVVEVRSADPAETRAVLEAVRREAGADVAGPVLDRLLELADYYHAGTAQPGRSVALLRRVLGTAATADPPRPITERDVLETLSTSTGIPVNFLDDAVPLDRARVRAFFESRVMGQSEAVDAVVDLVALVKAGLTDPDKPFGVLLFVGPTGVGKTELARSLAELLFGDAGRLVRLDMSEFATFEAHERLTGDRARPGLLAGAVRDRPFSVVLLDEIEKAHPNVFDLCLQIFDAGRLTDAHGRPADFRRTIIILTSNIGASTAGDGGLGFRPGAAPVGDRQAVLHELDRWFRPEFLNRLDRVVTFRPLEAETAEKIARREVARVLERGGIARRRLAVDVDPAVLALLLREGYSPTFGARPLKRTVERLVLLPVAWAIAAGRAPTASVLRLVARAGSVEVEVVAPEPTEPTERERAAAPSGVRLERVQALVERVNGLRAAAGGLAARKSELVLRAAGPDFWQNRSAARLVMDEIYRLDGVLSRIATLEKGVRAELDSARTRRITVRDPGRLERRLEGLESQADHLAALVSCKDARDLGDAFVCLSLVSSQGPGLDAVVKLAEMYRALARRRGFEVDVVDDRHGGHPPEDSVTLLVTGAGACGLLGGEVGLHHVARGREERRGRPRRHMDRDIVRMELLPVPGEDVSFRPEEVRVETRPLDGFQGRLTARPRLEVQILHLASMTAVRLWSDRPKAQAVERAQALLGARLAVHREGPAPGTAPVVRRYVLGPTPHVRDLRLNRATGRLDRILQGHLDAFLVLPPAALSSGG